MAAPTVVAYAATVFNTIANKSTASFTWLTGDIFVIIGGNENDDANAIFTLTGGPGSYTLQQHIGAGSGGGTQCTVNVWTAVCASGGSGTFTYNSTNTTRGGIAVWQIRGGTIGTSAKLGGAGSAAKVISFTPVGTGGSLVLGGFFDWSAGVAPTVYTPTIGTVRASATASGAYAWAILEWTGQAAGTRNYGVTTGFTSTTNVAKVVIEILGTSGGAQTAALTPSTVTLSGVNLGRTPGAVAAALTPSSVALTGIDLGRTPGAVAAALTPSTITLTGVDLGRTAGAATRALTPSVVTLLAQALVAAPGPVTVALTPSTVMLLAQTLGRTAGATTRPLDPSVITLVGQTLGVDVGGPPAQFGALTPSLITVTGVQLDRTPGTVSRALQPSVITVEGLVLGVGVVVVVGGLVFVWSGIDWVAHPVKHWNGATWKAWPLRVFNGADWVLA